MALLTFFETLIIELVVSLIILFAGSVVYYFKSRQKTIGELQKSIVKISNDVDDLQKLAVLQAKLIDTQTKKLHPNESSQLEALAKGIIDRKNGSWKNNDSIL